MVQKHIRMETDTFKKLQARAKENKRSLNMEINVILESAVNPIQVIGKIEDGIITIEEELARRQSGTQEER